MYTCHFRDESNDLSEIIWSSTHTPNISEQGKIYYKKKYTREIILNIWLYSWTKGSALPESVNAKKKKYI